MEKTVPAQAASCYSKVIEGYKSLIHEMFASLSCRGTYLIDCYLDSTLIMYEFQYRTIADSYLLSSG